MWAPVLLYKAQLPLSNNMHCTQSLAFIISGLASSLDTACVVQAFNKSLNS